MAGPEAHEVLASLVRPSAPRTERIRRRGFLRNLAGMTSSLNPLPLGKRPIVQPPVEPILVTRDVLLHGDVDVRLEQRDAGHIGESGVNETLHVLVVAGLVTFR